MISTLALFIFPVLMAYAASADLLTMRIANWLGRLGACVYLALALWAQLSWADIGMSAAAAAVAIGATCTPVRAEAERRVARREQAAESDRAMQLGQAVEARTAELPRLADLPPTRVTLWFGPQDLREGTSLEDFPADFETLLSRIEKEMSGNSKVQVNLDPPSRERIVKAIEKASDEAAKVGKKLDFQLAVATAEAMKRNGRESMLEDGKIIYGTMHEKFGVFYRPGNPVPHLSLIHISEPTRPY